MTVTITTVTITTRTVSGPPKRARFVDAEALICPGCGERVRCAPPAYWRVRDGLPVPQFSHENGTALCRTRAGMVAEPIEAT